MVRAEARVNLLREQVQRNRARFTDAKVSALAAKAQPLDSLVKFRTQCAVGKHAVEAGVLRLLDREPEGWIDFARGARYRALWERTTLRSGFFFNDLGRESLTALSLYLAGLEQEAADRIRFMLREHERFDETYPEPLFHFTHRLLARAGLVAELQGRSADDTELGPYSPLIQSLSGKTVGDPFEKALRYRRAEDVLFFHPFDLLPVEIWAYARLCRSLGLPTTAPAYPEFETPLPELPKNLDRLATDQLLKKLLRIHGTDAKPKAAPTIKGGKPIKCYSEYEVDALEQLEQREQKRRRDFLKSKRPTIADLEAAIVANDDAALDKYFLKNGVGTFGAGKEFRDPEILNEMGFVLGEKTFRAEMKATDRAVTVIHFKDRSVAVRNGVRDFPLEEMILAVARLLSPDLEMRAVRSTLQDTDILLLIQPPQWWKEWDRRKSKLMKEWFTSLKGTWTDVMNRAVVAPKRKAVPK